jgi:hypothetical protein
MPVVALHGVSCEYTRRDVHHGPVMDCASTAARLHLAISSISIEPRSRDVRYRGSKPNGSPCPTTASSTRLIALKIRPVDGESCIEIRSAVFIYRAAVSTRLIVLERTPINVESAGGSNRSTYSLGPVIPEDRPITFDEGSNILKDSSTCPAIPVPVFQSDEAKPKGSSRGIHIKNTCRVTARDAHWALNKHIMINKYLSGARTESNRGYSIKHYRIGPIRIPCFTIISRRGHRGGYRIRDGLSQAARTVSILIKRRESSVSRRIDGDSGGLRD